MDERQVTLYCASASAHISSVRAAAYQVGLSFLTQHMRRAVAACTSPEVLFRVGGSVDPNVQIGVPAVPTDVLGLALENLNLGTTAPVPQPTAVPSGPVSQP
jgi:alpha,alpha-trehalase